MGPMGLPYYTHAQTTGAGWLSSFIGRDVATWALSARGASLDHPRSGLICKRCVIRSAEDQVLHHSRNTLSAARIFLGSFLRIYLISEICRVSLSQDFETNHLIISLQRQIRACFPQEGRHLDKGGRFKAVVDLRPPSPSRHESRLCLA